MNKSGLCKSVVVFGNRLLSRAAACLRAVAVLLLALAWFGNTARAANRTWDGGGADNNWLTVTNWDGDLAAPSATDLLFFAGSTRLTATNNFAANTAFNGLTFNSGAGAFTLWGNAINLGGGITNNSTSLQTINLNLALTATRNIEVVSAGSLTIGGVVSGTGFGLTKSGAGTLTLSGVNTFTGGMTIMQGTVSVGTIANVNTAQPLGKVPSVTLGSSGQNGTLQYSGATATTTMPFILAAGGTGTFQIDNAATVLTRTVAITGSGGLIKSGAGTLQTTSGPDSYSGNTTVNAGILRVSFNSNPNTTYYLNGGIIVQDCGTFDRPVIVTADGSGFDGINGRWFTGTLTSSGGNYTLNMNTSSVANSLTMVGTVTAGAGLTLLLDVQKGSLILDNSTAFADNRVSLQLESAATLDMFKVNATFGALSGSGTVSDTAGNPSATSVLTLGGTNSATFSGVIENGTKTTALVRTNTGTQTLSGPNTFTGGSTIKGGTILIGVSNVGTTSGALGPSTAAVFLGDTTGSQNASLLTAGAFTFANAVTVTAGSSGTATLGGSTADASIFSGNITLNKSAILTAVNGGNATFSGVISGAGFGITKTDAGTVTLSGANSFGGVLTVSAGTVSISTINNVSVAGVLGNSANAVVLGASGATGTLRYTGATASSTKTFTMAAGGTGTFQVDSSATTLTLSGAIGGTGALTKAGAGTLTFSGSANTYSGVTTVNEGTLVLGKAASTTSIAGALTIGDGSGTDTVQLTAANQIADTSAVTINTGGVLNLNGNSDTIASLAMTAGSVATGAGTLTLGGDVAGNAAATSATISGNLSLGTAVRTFTIADGSATDDMAISAVISGGSGNGLTKAGAGTLTLSGANIYSGITTISAGKVKVQSNTALGNTTGASSVASGAAIVIDGSGLVIAENISSLIGDGGGSGGLENLLGLNTESGTIGFGGAARINSTAGTLTLSGAISGNGHAMTYGGAGNITISSIISGAGSPLTYDGGGTLTLSGANTYTGDTTVSAGTLKLGANNVIPNGSGKGNVSVSGILDLAGFSQTVNGLSGGGSVNNSTGSGSLTTGNNNASSTFGGVISGAVAFTKTGTGTQTFSGNNTYTGGTTLSQGTLKLGAADVLPSSGTFNFAGGILDANNQSDSTIGALSLTASSTLLFHVGGGAGSLTFASAAWTAGTLTISGWDGVSHTTGADDKLFVNFGSASQDFLDNIFWTDQSITGSMQLGSGEIVPLPEPINVALGVFGAVFLVFGFGRRLYKSARGKRTFSPPCADPTDFHRKSPAAP